MPLKFHHYKLMPDEGSGRKRMLGEDMAGIGAGLGAQGKSWEGCGIGVEQQAELGLL